jgi:hypothetical protein
MSIISPDRKSPHVPGQYYGYSLQTTRFLAWLLTCDEDWAVSLEVFEDVGVEQTDGSRVVEQVKSTSDGNPVANRSVELWKTFANWIDAVEHGELLSNRTKFEIYVSRPRHGVIVDSFAQAGSATDARHALLQAKSMIWGTPPNYEQRLTVADKLRPYVTRVFEADQDVVCAIIQSFELVCGTGSPQADLRELLAKALIPPDIIEDTLLFSLGWVKEQTDRLIEQQQPAVVLVKEFRTRLIAFVRKHDRRTILVSVGKKPSQEAISTDLASLKTYLVQLDLIECDDDDKVGAVTDYLRAVADRTYWSAEGLVDEGSFDEFEEILIRNWKNNKTKIEISHTSANDVQRGKYLYSECCLVQARIEGLDVPPHFVAGSFHALSDALAVGWHPNYQILVSTRKAAGNS